MAFFTKLTGEKTPAGLESEMERVFGQGARASGSPLPKRRPRTAAKTDVPVEVRKPRVSKEQIDARRKAELEELAETRRRHNEQYRQKQEALKTVRDPLQPISVRMDAAPIAGFSIIRRGPQDHPRRIIFLNVETKERICFAYPKGKNARYLAA